MGLLLALLLVTTTDQILSFSAPDGTPLEAKLTRPDGVDDPPVVFYLHGAGVRSYDNPFRYADENGAVQVGSYLDYHAAALAQRGVAFFRMSKRGCTALDEAPYLRLDTAVFGRATPSVLLADYGRGLEELRRQEGVDAGRIVLLGSSEGTYLAPQLARQSPRGVRGVVMYGFAADPARETVIWQNSVGPWRRLQQLVPEARDGVLTREEYESVIAARPELADGLPFDRLDHDHDDQLDQADLAAAARPRLERILKAVEERDDAFLTRNLLQLTSAYLLDWWEVEPTVTHLLQLDIPLAIFHGELDDTCRVEGVREAEAAFREADKDNLEVFLFPEGDHGLGWTWEVAQDGGPEAFQQLFDHCAELLEG